MWIRGTRNKKLRAPTPEDKAHGKGRDHSEEYWTQRINAAIGDGLLQLDFSAIRGVGLYKPQIVATIAITAEGQDVLDGKRKWIVLSNTASGDQAGTSCPVKKKRRSGGSNITPVVVSLLSSSSNWYEITSTSQYQYPGVLDDTNATSLQLGHVQDISKLPHFTGDNYHLLYTENQLSKGHYNDIARVVPVNGEEQNVHIRYAACQGVLTCDEEGCSFTASKNAKKCSIHPSSTLTASGSCPVYVVYVYPADYQHNHERWIAGVTKDYHFSTSTSNLHNHTLPPAHKMPSIVEKAVNQAVRNNPGLTPSQMDLGK